MILNLFRRRARSCPTCESRRLDEQVVGKMLMRALNNPTEVVHVPLPFGPPETIAAFVIGRYDQ